MATHIEENSLERSSENAKAVEHLIDMEGNYTQFEAFLKKNEDIPPLFLESCIFKVPEGLRRTNPEAYTPVAISIGPYHHGDPKLCRMEKFKVKYLQSFLTRTGLTMEKCWERIKGLQADARKCYADEIALSGHEFVKMLMLDGCFIVEFVLRSYPIMGPREYDPTLMTSWMRFQVVRDMLLLENQLPYFVLKALYDMIDDAAENREAFSGLVKYKFQSMLPKLNPFFLVKREVNDKQIKHLLEMVHILCHPAHQVSDMDDGQHQQVALDNLYSLLCRPWTCFHRSRKQSEGSTQVQYYTKEKTQRYQIRTVSELHEAGVHFEKVCEEDDKNLFNIKFRNGILEIPTFKVDHTSEIYFRNLIAYEQCSWNVNPKYVTDYAMFMDQLINTENDVNLLRLKGIIVNWLGDDKEVTTLFNKLCEGGADSYNFYYSDVCKKLTQHCNKPWNVLMTKLRRDYFHTPWATISTVAAIVLLLLTAAQTVASFLGLRW